MTIHKLLLKGAADDLARLEEFFQHMSPLEYAAGVRLRALAVELARRPELEVSAVAYQDESLELEVILASDRFREPVRIGRDQAGEHCQVSWEWWTEIKEDTGIGKAAHMIVAVLTSYAANQ